MFVSYSQHCPGIIAADFLRQAQGRERFYWEHNGTVYAGFGLAAEFTAWGENRFQTIHAAAANLFENMDLLSDAAVKALPRLFGGFSFRSDFVTENVWAAFAPAYFVLPHYQFTQVDGETYLTVNVQVGDGEDVNEADIRGALEAEYEALLETQAHVGKNSLSRTPLQENRLAGIDYPMSFEAWADVIEDATERMQAGELQKVVLSRVCELRFGEQIDVDSALDFLWRKYAGCTIFLFEPSPYLAFYGATPELLVSVQGRQIETMGLAGSIRRGATQAEDDDLARELSGDPKNRYEHALVVEAIRERLSPLTETLMYPNEPEILRLSNIQHLYTPIRGMLKEASGVVPLVAALHPTPAMGGVPQERAMDYIAAAEPVPRGWYASPVGWVDYNLDGAFAVAIRSAISQKERVWLYAGAGIVADSEPQKEWDETALKFKPMLDALGAQASEHA